LRGPAKGIFQQLKDKGIAYWLTGVVVLFLAFGASGPAYRLAGLTERKAELFQWLLEKGPRPPEPHFIKLVLIDDDEYWEGGLAGRRPIKRDYLADLVEKIAFAKANVIALDFDVRLPDPKSAKIPTEYEKETERLIGAIKIAAEGGTRIVLATSLSTDSQGDYILEPDIYRLAGLCQRSEAAPDAIGRNVTCGYIQLPYDRLAVPGPLRLADGRIIDSFGAAVARAERPTLIAQRLARIGSDVSYTNFISEEKFDEYGARVSAKDIRAGQPEELEKLRAAAVIVGAHWSLFASGRGPTVDLHSTPIGQMVGAVMHANFAEALLDSRTYAAAPKYILEATELAFGVFAAVVFALIPGFWKVAGLAGMTGLLLVIQWGALHGFGLFFDAFVPLLGLGLHAIFERFAGVHPADEAQAHTPLN